jgi:hypothetical protein
MMSRGVIMLSILLMLVSCEGKLTDEQRKALKEEMKDREIKKVSEEQIFNKALEQGKTVMADLNSGKSIDEATKLCACKISYIEGDNRTLSKVEKDLYDAYSYNPQETDNIQKDGDLLIYSRPFVHGDSLSGIWFIKFEKRDIVMAL